MIACWVRRAASTRHATSTPVEGGWGILLDGKALRSPAKRPFVLPTEALAAAIAEEWQAQGEKINPHSMPLMQFAATAIDRLADDRDGAGRGSRRLWPQRSDLLSRRRRRRIWRGGRRSAWQPLIAWVAERYDVALNVTTGIVAVEQPAHALATFRRVLAPATSRPDRAGRGRPARAGSLVIALALAEGRLSADEAADAALLDELYQAEKWGSDPEAESAAAPRSAPIWRAAKRFHTLSRL